MSNLLKVLDILVRDTRDSIYKMQERNTENVMGFSQFAISFRTIALNLPRQIGKTYALNMLLKQNSAIIAANNLQFSNRGYCYGAGLKYSMILFDEHTEMTEDILNYVQNLKLHGLLSKDFVIVMLGTKYV